MHPFNTHATWRVAKLTATWRVAYNIAGVKGYSLVVETELCSRFNPPYNGILCYYDMAVGDEATLVILEIITLYGIYFRIT